VSATIKKMLASTMTHAPNTIFFANVQTEDN